MIDIAGFDPMRDLPPPVWAAAGALVAALVFGVLGWLRRRFFPKRAQPEKPRRSLANAVTLICAAAVLVFAGEGIFEVASRVAPGVKWLPWLGIGLLEGPLLAFALRAKELIEAKRREEAGQSIRLTWLFAGMSALISASAALGTGDLSLPLIRAAAPIIGVILWHHALNIELNEDGQHKRQSRWKYTPEYILTRLGWVTARATETADAEIHQRLTRVADWVIRYARSVQRNTRRNSRWNAWWYEGWNTFCRVRMERLYRAAERDFDLTRNADRRALLEQIIESRSDAVLLTTLAGVTRTDLGLPEVEQPAEQPVRNTRIVFHQPAEQQVRNTRIVFHERVVEQPVERPTRNTRIVFHKTAEQPARTDRNTSRKEPANPGGTAGRNGRNSGGGTAGRNGGTPNRNGSGKLSREEINAAIADKMTPTGKVPVRQLSDELGVPLTTMHRHVVKYLAEHGPTAPAQGVIPPPLINGHQPASVGGGHTP